MKAADQNRSKPRLIDFHPPRSDIRADILEGLQRAEKQLPAKYFYDAQGSRLFEEITRLPEYYLTRTERSIMEAYLPEMADLIGPNTTVIEFGSGTGEKIRQLLSHLEEPRAAVTVEISRGHLLEAAERQARQFPGLQIIAVCADFMRPFELPPIEGARRRLVFFPGSTIGNFTPAEAKQLLSVMHGVAGQNGALLLGADLHKDSCTLEAAYNDSAGVTARFNLNLLARINREMGADFELRHFSHRAIYNRESQRIEMYLVSQAEQVVNIGGERIRFHQDEHTLTEYSHKYDLDSFQQLADESGFRVRKVWTDTSDYFGVFYLEA